MVTMLVVIGLIVVGIALVTVRYVGAQQTAEGSQTMNATMQRLKPMQYQTDFVQTQTPHLLLDVRTSQEFASGHIEGAQNISLQDLPQRMNELPKDKPIVLYCRSGNRSNTAARMLQQAGFTDVYDLGGVIAWQAQGLPLY